MEWRGGYEVKEKIRKQDVREGNRKGDQSARK